MAPSPDHESATVNREPAVKPSSAGVVGSAGAAEPRSKAEESSKAGERVEGSEPVASKAPPATAGAEGGEEKAAASDSKEEVEEEPEVVEGSWNLPGVKLDRVEPKTGEEDESEVWKCRGKLYRFRDGEWKERGLGDAKLLKSEADKKIRFLLRQEKTGKVQANHFVLPADNLCKLVLNAGNDKICVWTAYDCSDEEHEMTTFALRFGSPDDAQKFMTQFEKAGESNLQLKKDDKF